MDHPDDLEFVRAVWSYLDRRGSGPFNFEEIMSAVIESGATQGKAIINEGFYLSLLKAASAQAAPPLSLEKSFAWLERSERVIPGSRPDLFEELATSHPWRHSDLPGSWKGAIVTDVDGNEYVDLIQGLLAKHSWLRAG